MANAIEDGLETLKVACPHLPKTEVLERLLVAWRAIQPVGAETAVFCEENVDVAKGILVLAMSTLELRKQVEDLARNADPNAVLLPGATE